MVEPRRRKGKKESLTMTSVSRGQNQGQEKTKCSRTVRDLPLERFRLPLDGRKWKSLASTRAAVLLHLSTFANGDGTFQRTPPGRAHPRNYSPSEKRLTQRFAKATLYRRTLDLRMLDLLDWDRPTRSSRRVYTITADRPYPDDFLPRVGHIPDSSIEDVSHSTGCDVSYSEEKDVSDSQSDVSDSRLEVSYSQSGRLTSETIPSLPSLPSTTKTPQPPAPKTGAGGLNGECLYSWHDQLLAIQMGRKTRIPSLEKNAERRESAQEVCDFLNRRGFHAHIVTETIIVPDHIPRLDPKTRHERNLVNCGGATPEQARLTCMPRRKA